MKHRHVSGFTLIELAIVLVIIGLVVGGVLVGRDLISAAGVRSQIAQIESFLSAASTFRGKYGYLPGDIPNPDAVNFGFVSRGPDPGEGDGNGILEGISGSGGNWGIYQTGGETSMFWRDLSQAKLIPGSFTRALPATAIASLTTATMIDTLLPRGAIGRGNYLMAWNYSSGSGSAYHMQNMLGLAAVTTLEWGNTNSIVTGGGITPREAYSIDAKMDDGLPRTGNIAPVRPIYAGSLWIGATSGAIPASATTCYDNGNNASATWVYSIHFENGQNVTCVLSRRFAN